MSNSVRPHRWQPTRIPRPWNSPGKNTGVGCHFLLQCVKVKSESEVTQSCLTLSNHMDCSLPGSSVHGIFQARVLEWGAIAFSGICHSERYIELGSDNWFCSCFGIPVVCWFYTPSTPISRECFFPLLSACLFLLEIIYSPTESMLWWWGWPCSLTPRTASCLDLSTWDSPNLFMVGLWVVQP